MDQDPYVSEELRAEYGLVPAPKTIQELQDITEIPAFADDKHMRGWVVMDPGWLRKYLVVEWFPLLGQKYVHRSLVVPLHAALSEIAASPFSDYIKPLQCGIWAARRQLTKLGNPLSTHALAMALDINSSENPLGSDKDTIRRVPFVIQCFEKRGFEWGGRWKNHDRMHFQFLSSKIQLPR